MSSPSTSEGVNPLFLESTRAYHLPLFDLIKNEHFLPAFEKGMEEELKEIAVITSSTEPPTFENTFVAKERAGALLGRTHTVFESLISAHTNDALELVRTEMAPRLAAHSDAINLDPSLFRRVKVIYEERKSLNLDPESLRLVEITHRDFVRAGANLSDADKVTLKGINSELASLSTQFSQNVLNEVNRLCVIVEDETELDGLSPDARSAALKEAEKRKFAPGTHALALLNTSGQPALSSLTNRSLRKRILDTSLSRGGCGGEFDNLSVLSRTIQLRADHAKLLGYEAHADYCLEVQTALTKAAVNERLDMIVPAAVANAQKEASELKEMAEKDGVPSDQFGAHDWAFYSERLRAERFSFDEAQLRPYLELNSCLENGIFFAATRLYGITFKERKDLPTYHEDVRVFEVFNEDGSELSLFLFDPYARSSKQGGAWMNEYVTQSRLLGHKPLVANHLNVTKPSDGEPALLTFDDVVAMFHEFGHALHGMLSDVNYASFAGTNVPADFVEFPSQVNEMWAVWPEVLTNYARHHATGEVIPRELVDKVLAAQTFNQGFETCEYLAATVLDQAWHQLKPDEVTAAVSDVPGFELRTLARFPSIVPPRYRSTYFSHIMGGYSAGYYSYIWSEVLDADTAEWFKQGGGLSREMGERFRSMILSRGGSADATTLFREFRGQDPSIEPLLKRRGLAVTE